MSYDHLARAYTDALAELWQCEALLDVLIPLYRETESALDQMQRESPEFQDAMRGIQDALRKDRRTEPLPEQAAAIYEQVAAEMKRQDDGEG